MHADADTSHLDEATRDFLAARPRIFGIAYRILGSTADAEEIVQEAWLRWQGTDRSKVVAPTAFLTTVTTRLAINRAQSAQMRRESYVGPWLPEPVDTSDDPYLGAVRAAALDLAVLFLLGKLNAVERAAYVLREAFEYPYKEIAAILSTNEANTRQLVSRARKHLAAERHKRVGPAEHRRLLEVFLAAAREGDVAALEGLLAADVASYSDGNGMRGASKIPVFGRLRVARYLAAFAPRFWAGSDVRRTEANGSPALLVSAGGTAVALLVLDVSLHGIDRILWVMNPAKLEPYVASLAG